MRVLVAYDGSAAARAAVASAGALFAPADATVVHVRDPEVHYVPGAMGRVRLPEDVVRSALAEIERRVRERSTAIIEEGETLARNAGLEAHGRSLTGARPWRRIEDAVIEYDADLIVTGTNGLPPVGRAFLGSTASSLLHHSPVPVLVVPAGAATPTRRAVIAYDGSPSAEEALHFAADHLRSHHVLIAHVWRSPVRHAVDVQLLRCMPSGSVRTFVQDFDRAYEDRATETAERGVAIATSLGLDAEPRVVESPSTPWHALLRLASDEHCRLIVSGAERGDPVTSALGSVSSGLVHHATRAILLVPRRAVARTGGASERGADRAVAVGAHDDVGRVAFPCRAP